ncbi:uncharacterized protein LOC113381256 [Ctenocephalides felis]|uniref:uncharacterized protein LOC113381256 n=1 Tax=Ctenocephalides felis TaxID=7515 RepID=UPI000E6E4E34|nr:uncharacterized protein LOC113381256 [Ctenocephalides felis]
MGCLCSRITQAFIMDEERLNQSGGEDSIGSSLSDRHSRSKCDVHGSNDGVPAHVFTSVALMESRPGTTELSSLQHNNYSPTQCNHCEGHDTDDDSEQEEMSESTSNSLVCSPAASCQHTIEHSETSTTSIDSVEDIPSSLDNI